ncbi:RING finger protein 11 [Neodiprion pinetum]|uniref:RING finger protein 11 n=1 Tax=Neodiprion lecontei TaxID=441921 RepID=A0A6J0CDV5_NEOLC|nr:RING finger protein 11 [Neodiprion lecontei]XP_046426531.1 RING finger protein 11 [Neodiprion fabricii]XP_046482912.1 RING finger protein 11 [Neodiprion pinetum]XP_046620409.1 RING finger protein 11 [Neodiprion virginianus]
MGNCLKCSGGGQQDNTTLLNNSPDPALTGGASQEALGPPPPYNEIASAYYPPMGTRDRHQQLTELGMGRGTVGMNPIGSVGFSEEEQQVRIAKRIGLIQHLPTGEYDGSKKGECVICMMELITGEEVRYLPCMHTYHAVCIDDWLLRSLTCPSCMEPVDAALINSYYATT